ncbi:MAG: DUF1559 domain-containing protein [Pirellulaceae bacterium]
MGMRYTAPWLLAICVLFWSGCGGNQQAEGPGDGADEGNPPVAADGAGDGSQTDADPVAVDPAPVDPAPKTPADVAGDGSPSPAKGGGDDTPPNGKSPPQDVAQTPAAPTGKLDTTYITDDFAAALVVHPQRALESKLVKSILSAPDALKRGGPLEELEMAASGEMPGGQINQIIGLLAPSEGALKVEIAAILRFVDGESAAELTNKIKEDGEQRQHNGKTYYYRDKNTSKSSFSVPNEFVEEQIADIKQFSPGAEITQKKNDDGTTELTIINVSEIPPGVPTAAYLPDEKTVVMATEPLLKKMIDAQGVSSPLIDRLTALGDGHDLAAVAFVGKLRPAVEIGLDSMGPGALPPMLSPLVSMIDVVDTASITAGLDASPLLEIKIESTDQAGADRLEQQLNGLIQMGKGMYGMFAQSTAQEQPKTKPLFDYGDKFLAGVKLIKNGKQIVASLPQVTDVEKLPAMVEAAVGEQIAKVERMNRLRQVMLGVHNHMDAEGLLPGNIQTEDGKPLLSWRVALLPYVEEGALLEQFVTGEAWDSEANKKASLETPEVYKSVAEGVKPGHTVYLTFQGPGTLIDGKQQSFATMTDGLSNTIGVIEVSPAKAVPWAKPTDIDFTAPDLKTALGPPPTKEGYPAAFFDGRVDVIPGDTDMETFKRLVNFRDGQPVELP